MKHYGEDMALCKAKGEYTNVVGDVTCPMCLLELYRACESDGWYDREQKSYVDLWDVERVIILHMYKSTQVILRGIVRLKDGRIYTLTIRHYGQGDTTAIEGAEVRFILTKMQARSIDENFFGHAWALLHMEQEFMTDLCIGKTVRSMFAIPTA